jgi:Leucine-rich repeat (LRR) protein
LRTIINDLPNPKQSQLNQNGQQQVPMDEAAEGLDEIALLQVDSPEDNFGNDEEGADHTHGEYADNVDGTEESDVLENARMDELISDVSFGNSIWAINFEANEIQR